MTNPTLLPPPPTITTVEVINALAQHLGRHKGISARLLAAQLGIPPRTLRRLISMCRERDGAAICGHPVSGYYIAVTPEDLEETCRFLEQRAMHSLRLLSRMRRMSMPDLVGQLRLNQA